MTKRKLVAVFIASSVLASTGLVAHAAQIQATTQTQITHQNPGTVGTGAVLEITPATWAGRSPTITFNWQYRLSCTSNATSKFFSLTSGGQAVSTQQLTIPATIYVDADGVASPNYVYDTALATSGLAILGISEWSLNPDFGSSAGESFNVGSGFCSQGTSGGSRPVQSPSPKYSGPEFSSFGEATLAGNKVVVSGKKLDSIASMKINGSSVTYKVNSASELEIELPKDLAPGKYDVEITSSHGKLTHLKGITIKAVIPTKELVFRGEGAWLNYESLLDLTNAAKQIGSEYTSVKCIVNAADPAVAERLAKRACDYIEANRLRGKDVTYESKSTYKGEGFWVKIVANG